ncbi:hypothetical protein Hanom_Chr07g00654771 [Helianthus anomalus]
MCSFAFINVRFHLLPKINKQTRTHSFSEQTNTNINLVRKVFVNTYFLTNEHEQGLVRVRSVHLQP